MYFKVRAATNNDPWGPSATLMTEIADMTHDDEMFAEIMQMIWQRLSDRGRNWRHVCKSLIVLDFITKAGSTKVVLECRENMQTIFKLKVKWS